MSSLFIPLFDSVLDEDGVVTVDKKPAGFQLTDLSKDLNLPQEYLKDKKMIKYRKSKDSCVKFPYVFDIKFSNIYWQVLETSTGVTFYLFGAYRDMRKANKRGPAIVILATTRSVKPPPTYCQIWFEDSKTAVVSKVVDVENGGRRFDRLSRVRNRQNNGVLKSFFFIFLPSFISNTLRLVT